MPNTKKIILCADDFGQNLAISEGIVQLIKKKRLSATTCMTNLPDWPEHASLLKPYLQQVQLGLHFNLTRGPTLTRITYRPTQSEASNLATLIQRTYLKNLTVDEVKTELNAQIDHFSAQLGTPPDFIDGHQHIQQLPVIRQALVEVFKQRLPKDCYTRLSTNGLFKSLCYPVSLPKSFTISLMGTQGFKRLLNKNHIPYNPEFSGCYNFNKAQHYRQYFLNFLKQIKHTGLIMCHPGLPENDSDDLLKFSRPLEYQYLRSDTFLHDCRSNQVELQTLQQQFPVGTASLYS